MSDVEGIARAVEAYLTAHPDAADGVEGVTSWWVSTLGIVASVEATEAALEMLVRRGVVRLQRSADGRIVYSRREGDGRAGALSGPDESCNRT
ncbi:MAG: hypothetical protein H6R26_617 [Proteobacteria bacterium]|nr:hypothetical protein [Pseudomonadota bacterium]